MFRFFILYHQEYTFGSSRTNLQNLSQFTPWLSYYNFLFLDRVFALCNNRDTSGKSFFNAPTSSKVGDCNLELIFQNCGEVDVTCNVFSYFQISVYNWTNSWNVWTTGWRLSNQSSRNSRTFFGDDPKSKLATAETWKSWQSMLPTDTSNINRSKIILIN